MAPLSVPRASCVLALLLLATPGCGKTDGTQLRATLGVDMIRVTGFVLTQGAGTAASALQGGGFSRPQGDTGSTGGASQLYVLSQDGSLTTVTVTQEGQSGSETATPFAVFDTPRYELLAYHGVSHGSDTCNFVAARKTDGALYCVTAPSTSVAQAAQRGAMYGALVQADGTGNLVWINHDSGVSVLDFTDPDHVTQSTPAGSADSGLGGVVDGPFGMAVNGAGDALVTDINGTPKYTRVLFPAGGFFDVTGAMETCLVAGPKASPDDFYYATNGPSTLVKLARTSATSFTKTVLASIDFLPCAAGTARAGSHLFLTSSPQATSPDQIVEIVADVPTARTVEGLASVQQIGACEASLFILGTDESGNGGIVRYDVAGGGFTTLVAPGEFALTTMAVSPGCEVTFYGQRAADGAYLLGNVAAGSTTVKVDATGFPTVSQIQRIE